MTCEAQEASNRFLDFTLKTLCAFAVSRLPSHKESDQYLKNVKLRANDEERDRERLYIGGILVRLYKPESRFLAQRFPRDAVPSNANALDPLSCILDQSLQRHYHLVWLRQVNAERDSQVPEPASLIK